MLPCCDCPPGLDMDRVMPAVERPVWRICMSRSPVTGQVTVSATGSPHLDQVRCWQTIQNFNNALEKQKHISQDVCTEWLRFQVQGGQSPRTEPLSMWPCCDLFVSSMSSVISAIPRSSSVAKRGPPP